MAADQRVALTRPHRMLSTSSHISKAARQVVPAFLQKLYEMVNDPNNADLIRWSESGDSFFVLDQERFAHEVLGRWFKHKNFSSFVRQLNMYGFHKIPHLQQGVLKSDTDTEFWNFAHANFHQGQPDLLCLIQRKKQTPSHGDGSAIELRDGNTEIGLIGGPNVATDGGAASGSPTLSNSQVPDAHSIVSGINTIKRHQTTISAELNELKRSNQLLWQDALAARSRHQKQQDTINRIVKFLAGVFGNHAAAGNAGGVGVAGGTSTVAGSQHGDRDAPENAVNGPKRRMRLMIEDAKRDGPAKSVIEDLTELPIVDTSIQYMDTPTSVPSPSPSVDNPYHVESKNDTPTAEPLPPLQPPPSTPQKQLEEQRSEISRAVTPSRSFPMIELDSRINNMINQLNPSQIQQLLASLAAQTITDPTPPSSSVPSGTINPNATSTLTQYQPPPFDFSQSNPSYNQIPIDGLISFDQLPGGANHSIVSPDQQQHEERTENQWQATEDIDKDVNAVDSSIDTLIQTFGLYPAIFEDMEQTSNEIPTLTMGGSSGAINPSDVPPASSEFDFDSFLNSFTPISGMSAPGLPMDAANAGSTTVGMDYGNVGANSAVGDLVNTPFPGEVQTPTAMSDMTASPSQPLSTGGSATAIAAGNNGVVAGNSVSRSGGRKRKSVDFDSSSVSPEAKSGAGGKPKKRKDK